MKFASMIVVSMTLVASTALAQQAPAPGRTLDVGEASDGISLITAGAEAWAQCKSRDEATDQERIQRTACRTLGYGLITNDAGPDKLVLCRDCFQETPESNVNENNESILGVIDSQGIPIWAVRHGRWFESGYDAKDVSIMDVNKDGRAELFVEEEIGGGLGYGRDFSILSWDGTTMKAIFSVALRELIADTEQMWNGSTRDEESTVEFIMKNGEAFGIRVRTFVGRDGKVNKKKGTVREFSWNPSKAIYEETKANKP